MATSTASSSPSPSIRTILIVSIGLLVMSMQINRVNTLPAFLYNFATSLTGSNQPTTTTTTTTTTSAPTTINNLHQQHFPSSSSSSSLFSVVNSGGASSANVQQRDQQQQVVGASTNNANDAQQMMKFDSSITPAASGNGNLDLQRAANGLQQQLSALQSQAQKQLTGTQNQKFHMLEVLSNMGKAIQQQLMNANPNGNIQIVTSPALGNANNKKNEYQAIGSAPEATRVSGVGMNGGGGQTGGALATSIGGTVNSNYREQGEQIRQDIIKRAGQLQQVLASSMDAIKDKGDVIVKRLLEQLNSRLDLAKSKADKIINEPATNEVAIKTLNAINQGLHNLNNIITNIVNRFDLTANKDATTSQKIAAGLAALNGPNGAERIKQQLAGAMAANANKPLASN